LIYENPIFAAALVEIIKKIIRALGSFHLFRGEGDFSTEFSELAATDTTQIMETKFK
jgi:hypothetical protein